jgi:kynurenine formamidase
MEATMAETDSIAKLASLFARMRPVDLSPKLERGIPRWPSHPHMIIDKTVNHEHDGYYCQGLVMAEHTGCHCDAPAHNHPGATTVDHLPIDQMIAPAALYDFGPLNMKPGDMLTPEMVENYERDRGVKVGPGEIALVNFGWMKRYWRCDREAQWYALNSPGMTEETAILFKKRGIKAIGADTVACEIALVDGVGSPATGHLRHWLPNGIPIIEMLTNLERLAKRSFFVAAPLPIDEGSGSPLRPIGFCEQ